MRVESYSKELARQIQDNRHMQFTKREDVAQLLADLADEFGNLSAKANKPLRLALQKVAQDSHALEKSRRDKRKNKALNEAGEDTQSLSEDWWHKSFKYERLIEIDHHLKAVMQHTESVNENLTIDENTPKFFPVDMLPDVVTKLAANVPGHDVAQFVDSLNLRIKGLFAAGPLASITDPGGKTPLTLKDWLEGYLGTDQASDNPLCVVNLSFVPSEVIHIVVAVLARMLFEAVQHHRESNDSELPTVLVLDEAHTFVHRKLTSESAPDTGKICCQTFERIAREGRKFGFGLVLASQRPSDISPTVLSQCNTFLLHRIVNDRDQDLVKHLVPDALGGLLRELPSLPSRRAILLGWGAPTPLLTEVRELSKEHRPHSHDPEFWDVWTGVKKPEVNWSAVAEDWTSSSKPTVVEPKPEISDKPRE